jgi:hypothetical protein
MEYKRQLILLISLFLAGTVQAEPASDCVRISDNTARLACYDSALGYKPKVRPERPQAIRTVTASPQKTVQASQSEPTSKEVLVTAQKAYDAVVADSKTMVITKVVETRQGKAYFYTHTDRIFKRMTDRSVVFKKDDQIQMQGGLLGSVFLVNQNGLRIKVREMK